MSKDMEMSCDEKVLSGQTNKRAYSTALLSFAANRRFPVPSPLAFGETGIESRIKNVLNWKKPAIWLTIAAMLMCMAAFVMLITNPEKDSSGYAGENYKVKNVVYESMFSSSFYDMREALTCTVISDEQLVLGSWSTAEEKWREDVFDLQYPIELTEENFDRHFMGSLIIMRRLIIRKDSGILPMMSCLWRWCREKISHWNLLWTGTVRH